TWPASWKCCSTTPTCASAWAWPAGSASSGSSPGTWSSRSTTAPCCPPAPTRRPRAAVERQPEPLPLGALPMSGPRVALIFDDTARPETTGVYCRRALEGLARVEHFRPADLERVPRMGFDLYLNIDDGLRYLLPEDLHPSVFWAIDTHLDFDWCLTKA